MYDPSARAHRRNRDAIKLLKRIIPRAHRLRAGPSLPGHVIVCYYRRVHYISYYIVLYAVRALSF